MEEPESEEFDVVGDSSLALANIDTVFVPASKRLLLLQDPSSPKI